MTRNFQQVYGRTIRAFVCKHFGYPVLMNVALSFDREVKFLGQVCVP
jgi:hypothetical protein